jgi:hypothetical protein
MGAFFAGPIGSFIRVFVAQFLTLWTLDLTDAVTIDFGAWQTYVIGALVSALPVLVAALNNADPRFGNTPK